MMQYKLQKVYQSEDQKNCPRILITLFTALSNLPGYNEWTFIGTTYQQDDISIAFTNTGMFPLSVVHYSNGCASPIQETTITVARCPELLFYIPNSFRPS